MSSHELRQHPGGSGISCSSRLALVAIGVLLAGARPAAADDVRAAVEAGNRAFIAAFLAGDAQAVGKLYTKTVGRVIPPGAPTASGRTEIASFWLGLMRTGVKDLALETAEVEAVGDLAYETGTVRLVGADDAVSVSRYLVVWKRRGDQWKMHRDTWN